MRFTIIGAGAIGGSAAAYLCRGGHEVLLVDNAVDHVEAIAQRGLTIEGREEFTVRVPVVTPAMLGQVLSGRPPEVVVLAVKAQHTGTAIEPILPFLGPDSFVVSMQNGLNPRIISQKLGPNRTVGAFINSMGADYLSPGRIMYGGPGTMYLGELDGIISDRVKTLARILATTFVQNTRVTDNIWGYLWGKEGYGAMLFASATVDETMADVLSNPANRALLANIAGEVICVADAENVRCESFDGYDPDAMRFAAARDWETISHSLNSLADLNRRSLKQKSGIWRDLAVRHRPTEIDAQIGTVVQIGRAHAARLPLLELIIALIHDIEQGRREMHPANIVELRELNRGSYPDLGNGA